jgi:capsular exopolysaccharide synthesis family protein
VNALTMIERQWPVSTEIRKLESRLWRKLQKDGRKVVVVTSPLQGEGKSTTTALLAVAAALHRNRKILAVDLDFRRPTLHTFFDAEPDEAFARYLSGEDGSDPGVRSTGIGDLDAIFPAPAENPDALVASHRLADLLEAFRPRYDLILVDVPALVPVADATGVIPLSDGILLAVLAGRSSKHQLARARELILGMDVEILGLVVGNIQEAAPHYLEAGYYHYDTAARGVDPRPS